MSSLVSGLGGLLGMLGLSEPPKLNFGKQAFRKSQFKPLIFLSLFGEGGLDPDAMSKFRITKKEAQALDRTHKIRFGKERFRIPTADELRELQQERETRRIRDFERSEKKLFGPDGPAFLQEIDAEAKGSLRERFRGSFGDLMAESLGGAAPLGTLTDENVLKSLSAPTALAAEQFFRGQETAARAQKFSTLGVPGITGATTAATIPFPTFGGLQNNFFQGKALQAQMQQANAELEMANEGMQASSAGGGAAGLGSILGMFGI